MEKKSYNNMYKPKTLREINDELTEDITAPVEEPAEVEPIVEEKEEKKEEIKEVKEEKIEEVKEEAAVEVPEVKKEMAGHVTGGLNLNVRKAPGGDIIKSISNGEKVIISNDSNPDWFEISSPVNGFVMKKFIKLV